VAEHERAGLTYGRAIELAWTDWRGLGEVEKTQILDQADAEPIEM
jgi:hypothetical protein